MGSVRRHRVRFKDGFGYARQLPQLADFDGALCTAAGRRNSSGPGDGLVQISAVEDIVAGELLLGLGEGSVDRQDLAVFHADGGSGVGSPERIYRHEHAALSSLVDHREMILPNLLGFLGLHGTEVAFLGVDQHHVAHRSLLLEVVRWPYTSTTPQRRKIDMLRISLYGGPAQETPKSAIAR